MKLFAIAWDIKSYDGERILSIWTSEARAESERQRLEAKDCVFAGATRVVAFEADKCDALEAAL